MQTSLASPARSFLAAVAFAAAALSPAFADESAEAFVSQILVEANSVFGAADVETRNAGIETLVDKYVDMNRVARFALGQYARVATDEQMAVYRPLFRKYATSVYQSTLDAYTGETLEVTGSVDRSARDIIVNSKVVGAKPGGQYADLVVHWRVYRAGDGAQTIVDAGASGVWLAIEQQSTFKSVIANNGGGAAGIDALIADLKAKVGE
ncbi:MAG: ABC transporter substrate-binding protein [Parvularculaceae bacterium]|nr:ABC transporter substrate-binding protein [Parvularculaceae bacterium]